MQIVNLSKICDQYVSQAHATTPRACDFDNCEVHLLCQSGGILKQLRHMITHLYMSWFINSDR